MTDQLKLHKSSKRKQIQNYALFKVEFTSESLVCIAERQRAQNLEGLSFLSVAVNNQPM